jgi:predicted transcriptional regulator
MTTNTTRNTTLRLYLDQYELAEHDVARTANVPLVTMWRAVRGQPITDVHAAAIRKALWRLSGDFYAGPIETGTEAILDLQTYREQRSGSTQ